MYRYIIIVAISLFMFCNADLLGQEITLREKEMAKRNIIELFFRNIPDSLHHLPYDSLRKYTDPYTFIIPKERWRRYFLPTKRDDARFGYGYYLYPGFTELSSVEYEGDAYMAGFVKGNQIYKINGRIPSSEEERETT